MRCKSAKTPLKTREDSSRNVKTVRIAMVMPTQFTADPAISSAWRSGQRRLDLVQTAPVQRASAFLWW